MTALIIDDRQLFEAIWVGLYCVLLSWLIVALNRYARSSRPSLRIGMPLAVAASARVGVCILVSSVPSLASTRGTDEGLFLELARRLARSGDIASAFSWNIEGAQNLGGGLHVWLMAAQMRIADVPGDFHLRLVQIALAVSGIAILSFATYDLAGDRPARIVAWVLALEPSNVFFSSLLHKEAPLLLGEALTILGCVRMFRRRDPVAAGLMASGLAIATLTRPYVAFGLALACLLVSLHASLRRLGVPGRRSPALALATVTAVITTSAVGAVVAPRPGVFFNHLQAAQNANTSDASNLRLAPVDFSTPEGLMTSAPRRMFDLLFRPYPWEIANVSQRLGVVGTLFGWFLLGTTAVLAARRPRLAVQRLPPLLYVALLLVVAYALATGNAGTGFRYRMHVLLPLAAAASVLLVNDRTKAPERKEGN